MINCLLPMIEKWRESIDRGGTFHTFSTNLPKTFSCLPHDLPSEHLHVQGQQ